MLNKVTINREQIVYLYDNDRLRAMQVLEEMASRDQDAKCLLETIPASGKITVAMIFDRQNRHAIPIATMRCTKETPYTAIREKFGF